MTEPLWYAGRAEVTGTGAAAVSRDLLNWAHPEKPQSWVIEVFITTPAGAGMAGTVTMSSTCRHAQGGLELAWAAGANGFARLIFGAQGDSGTVSVATATAGPVNFNGSVLQVSSTPINSAVTAW